MKFQCCVRVICVKTINTCWGYNMTTLSSPVCCHHSPMYPVIRGSHHPCTGACTGAVSMYRCERVKPLASACIYWYGPVNICAKFHAFIIIWTFFAPSAWTKTHGGNSVNSQPICKLFFTIADSSVNLQQSLLTITINDSSASVHYIVRH